MKIKSPLRFIIFLVTLVIVVWMCYNFVIALQTGQKFSFFGNSKDEHPVTNILVAGVDEEGYRTDTILYCQLNTVDNQLNILQIPRDTKVDNKRSDKKINSAYFSGIECLEEEIEQVVGLETDHHVIITFDALHQIVDAIGGVEIDVPIRMDYSDPAQNLRIDLQPGVQTLNGEQAEMFMRYRKNNNGGGYPDGDVGRLNAQKEFYHAVAKKVLSPGSIVKAPQIYKVIKETTTTDLEGGDMLSLLTKAVKLNTDGVQTYMVPGEGKYIGGVSYFVVDQTATKQLIQEHFTPDVSESSNQAATARDKNINVAKNKNISVKVVDASGAGVAEEVKKTLEESGFHVVEAVTWAEIRSKSSIIEYTSKKGSEELLKVYEGIPVTKSEKSKPEEDVTLIIGSDFKF